MIRIFCLFGVVAVFYTEEAWAIHIACNCTSNGSIPCNSDPITHKGQDIERECNDDTGKGITSSKVKCETETGTMICCAKGKSDDKYWAVVEKDPDFGFCKKKLAAAL